MKLSKYAFRQFVISVTLALGVLFIVISLFAVSAYADTVTVRIIGDTECSDGIDNDGDSEIDFGEDDGCSSTDDDNETDPVSFQCSDGIDNDSDGLTDFPNDQGCDNANDDDETDSTPSGGGGGGGSPSDTNVIFGGKAYPGSSVTLLKDGEFVVKTVIGPDANFDIRISNLSAGTHTFGIWGEDTEGRKSTTQTFTVGVTAGVSTSITGIFLPPTISVDKAEVKRGDILTVLGHTFPESNITVVFNSAHELIKKIQAGDDGIWVYNLDSLELEFGDHTTKSRATKKNEITSFSKILNFKVGNRNVLTTNADTCPLKGDFNFDCRVNLIDFSMLAFWYKRSGAPDLFDLNNDDQIDLIDFSITAFYWTG